MATKIPLQIYYNNFIYVVKFLMKSVKSPLFFDVFKLFTILCV